ncbi:serine/threonine protein kinase [bacterium]|nr:serine/threonine protein kinase [bacterium]
MSFTYSSGQSPLSRYKIQRGIGVGGFGEVYFALSDSGKEVALKCVQRHLEVELRGASQCLNLKHANLVSLFDICQSEDEQSWVVMEYVSGPNMRQRLDESPGGLVREDAIRWIKGMSKGVRHLHQSGVIHRDLKPANVFDDLGTIKVGDYGLSKCISASDRLGHTDSVGTVHYMAPEVGNGEYGPGVDIYAVGVIFYELLTGELPFDGETKNEILMKHLTAEPQLDSLAGPERVVVERCLQKDPKSRYPSMQHLLDALESITSGVDSDAVVIAEYVHTTDSLPPRADELGSQGYPLSDGVASRRMMKSDRSHSSKGDPSESTKLLVAGVIVLGLFFNPILFSIVLMIAVLCYLPYFLITKIFSSAFSDTSVMISAVSSDGVPIHYPVNSSNWRKALRINLDRRKTGELAKEWIQDSTGVIPAATVFGLITFSLQVGSMPVSSFNIAPYAWVVTMITIAAIGLHAVGKRWAGSEEGELNRRLFLGASGMIFGLLAFFVDQFLMLDWQGGATRDVDATVLPEMMYSDNVPNVLAFVSHFAILFFSLRWWKLVDPIRTNRVSLWMLLVAVVVEWLIHQSLPIRQPAGMLFAGGAVLVTQITSKWFNQQTRDGMISDYTKNQSEAWG